MLKTIRLGDDNGGDDGDDKPRVHIVVSPTVFVMLLSAVFTGGAGTYGIANKSNEAIRLEACVRDNQSSMHRLDELERKMYDSWENLDSRSRHSWTIEDQSRHERALEGRISEIEREVAKAKALCEMSRRGDFTHSSNVDSR